jgi:hypothetical protein
MIMPNRYSIVGTQFTGIPESFVAALKAGTPAVLVREPANPHDPNAIAVYVDGRRIGYVPKKQNGVLAQFIDQQGTDGLLVPALAMDGAKIDGAAKQLAATFVRSPNSGFPMVEV